LMAMKMENDIRAFESGVITALNVQKGDKVNVGDILLSIA
jgi:biotin carboxyl carrier protein